jgi:shikimate kinase
MVMGFKEGSGSLPYWLPWNGRRSVPFTATRATQVQPICKHSTPAGTERESLDVLTGKPGAEFSPSSNSPCTLPATTAIRPMCRDCGLVEPAVTLSRRALWFRESIKRTIRLRANPQCTPSMMITLIGYRGCGKTTVAPRVAQQLGWRWVDSDAVIEQQEGCSIQKIFAVDGEKGFRERETAVLKTLLTDKNVIVAAGGGAVLAEVSRHRMQAAGPVVWLTASPQTLAARISHDETTEARRPSLTGQSVGVEIREVLAVRFPIYQDAATHVIDTEARTLDEIVGQVVKIAREEAVGETFV